MKFFGKKKYQKIERQIIEMALVITFVNPEKARDRLLENVVDVLADFGGAKAIDRLDSAVGIMEIKAKQRERE